MSNKLTYEELEREIGRLEKEVDDRKQTERELQEERDRAQRYLEIAGVTLVVLNSDQTVQLINRKGCDVLGYEPDTAVMVSVAPSTKLASLRIHEIICKPIMSP